MRLIKPTARKLAGSWQVGRDLKKLIECARPFARGDSATAIYFSRDAKCTIRDSATVNGRNTSHIFAARDADGVPSEWTCGIE